MKNIISIKQSDQAEKKIRITDHFYNGFAEHVYVLENGTKLFISYSGSEIRIIDGENQS